MADLTATLANGGIGDNYLKNVKSQSDAGREYVLSITAAADTLTDAKLNAAINYLTTSHGSAGTGDSAGTIAAINTTDDTDFDPAVDTVVHARFQTSDTFTITGVNAAVTDVVVAIVATFRPAK